MRILFYVETSLGRVLAGSCTCTNFHRVHRSPLLRSLLRPSSLSWGLLLRPSSGLLGCIGGWRVLGAYQLERCFRCIQGSFLSQELFEGHSDGIPGKPRDMWHLDSGHLMLACCQMPLVLVQALGTNNSNHNSRSKSRNRKNNSKSTARWNLCTLLRNLNVCWLSPQAADCYSIL